MIGLPKSLMVNRREYAIQSDFRAGLSIVTACGDTRFDELDKLEIMLNILYDEVPDDIYEACKQAVWFLNAGRPNDQDTSYAPVLMDWEQDEQYIFAGIAKIAGHDVRMDEYCHWWTFLGYFMEIGEGTFSTIRSIRKKLAYNEKLEKWEREYYMKNASVIEIRRLDG